MSQIQNSRRHAFTAQGECCYYCNLPMWYPNLPSLNKRANKAFCRVHSLTRGQAKPLKCTAEHLVAKKDGGTGRRSNIVAACIYCNSRRFDHVRGDPSPQQFRRYVRVCMITRGWHRFSYEHMLPTYQRIIRKICKSIRLSNA
jgi:hypothetical protein